MKKASIILSFGFMLFVFAGCYNKETTNMSLEASIIKQVESEKANLFLMVSSVGIDERNVKLRVFLDDQLCAEGENRGNSPHNYIAYSLNVTEGSHIIKVEVNNKVNSFLRFEVAKQRQWIDFSYSKAKDKAEQIYFSISSNPSKID